MSRAAPPAIAARLRYRFDSVAQLARHFHRVDGSALFFFPGIELPKAHAVVLELQLASSEQSFVLRGHVRAAERGAFHGVWLDFAAARLAAGLSDAATSVRRRHRRLPADLLVQAQLGSFPFLCKMLDVGDGGARLSSGPASARPGTELDISLFGAAARHTPIDRARVVWTRPGELGAIFLRSDANARRSLIGILEELRLTWTGAPQVQHPRLCGCMRGDAPLEPPPPRVGHRRSLS